MQQSYRSLFNSLLRHFRPRTVPERTLRPGLTWGLSLMAAVLVFLLFSTGLLLKFVYEPFPDRAKAKVLVVLRSPGENIKTRGKVVDTIPHLMVRKMVVAMVLIACILVISMIFNAPLLDKASSGLNPNPTKTPSYLLGIQEMLMHFHPLFSLFIIPTLAVVWFLAIPFLRYQTNPAGCQILNYINRNLGRK